MILSKREKYISIFAAVAIGLLVADWYILSPLLERRDRLQKEIAQVTQRAWEPAQQLIRNKNRTQQRWQEMKAAGLQTERPAAESQVLHAVRDWATESGMSLSSVKPDRAEPEKQFQKLTIRATGTGTMGSVARFLERLHKGSIPLRVVEFQIGSRKEATDDLALQIGVSTLYLPPETEKKAGTIGREAKP